MSKMAEVTEMRNDVKARARVITELEAALATVRSINPDTPPTDSNGGFILAIRTSDGVNVVGCKLSKNDLAHMSVGLSEFYERSTGMELVAVPAGLRQLVKMLTERTGGDEEARPDKGQLN